MSAWNVWILHFKSMHIVCLSAQFLFYFSVPSGILCLICRLTGFRIIRSKIDAILSGMNTKEQYKRKALPRHRVFSVCRMLDRRIWRAQSSAWFYCPEHTISHKARACSLAVQISRCYIFVHNWAQVSPEINIGQTHPETWSCTSSLLVE